MRKLYVLVDFLVYILITFTGGAEAGVELAPPNTSVEKNVNEKYFVICKSSEASKSAGKFTWRGPGKNVIPYKTGRIHVEEFSDSLALVFDMIHRGDKGNYTCSLDANGVKEEASFNLVVIKPISFVNTPATQNFTETSNAVLRCEVDGYPTPDVAWQYKGRNPEDARHIKQQRGLLIKTVTLEDAGVYECRGFQIGLSATSTMESMNITLRVLHKPKWKKPKQESEITYGYLGGTVNLTCEVIADPEATFSWTRDKTQIKPAHYNATIINEPQRSILQFPIPNVSVFGEYGCEARNDYGRIERKIILKRGEKPEKPTKVIVGKSDNQTVALDIQSHGDDEIIGYRIQFVIKLPGTEYTWDTPDYQDFVKSDAYIVKDLLENTTYVMRVASRNAAGLSDYSDEVTVRTQKTSDTDVTGAAHRHVTRLIMIVTSVHVLFAIH